MRRVFLADNYGIVTVNVIYHMPDYPDLLNQFLWQTLDLRPDYPRIHRFLKFWRREIDAVIAEIVICDSKANWRNGIIFPT
jgi:uncharacterized protein Usg